MPQELYQEPDPLDIHPKKLSNKTLWIIILILAIILILCCCALTVVGIVSALGFGLFDQTEFYYFLPSLIQAA